MQTKRAFTVVVILWVVTTFRGATAQDVVRPGELSVRLKSIAAWDPVLDLSRVDLELTPTDVVPLDDGTGRLLIATLGGTIRVHHPDDGLLDQPLFNSQQSGLQLQLESGMTGIAAHPNFAGDPNAFGYGKLYTITTENGGGNGGIESERVDFAFENEVHQDVVREWDLSSIVGDDSRNVLPELTVGDSREILRVAQPGPFHNIVDLTFDRSVSSDEPDFGQLYISHGDGGNSATNDSSTQSRKQASQDRSSIYGNLLRINPDPLAHDLVRVSENTGEPAYSISPNNPFVDDDTSESRTADTLAEVFAYGLRSPYRVNIDSLEGTILFGDVGESRREEISIAESGGNLGWGLFEGTRLDNNFVELQGSDHTPPIFEYGREVGRSIVGGTVYRGSDFPQLFGKYVFADFGQAHPSAKLFYGSIDPADENYGEIFEFDLSRSSATFPVSLDEDATVDAELPLPDRIFSIGEDENGELLIIGGEDPRGPVDSVEGAFLIRLTRGIGCDVIGDGQCSIEDLDALVSANKEGSDASIYDVDWDDVFDAQDIVHWLGQASVENEIEYRHGDTNLDGNVDFDDFLRLANSFGRGDATWSEGNFDGVNGTQFNDFLLMANEFDSVAVRAVPEPRLRFGFLWVVAAWLMRVAKLRKR